jgi:hypothetical protein
MDYLDTYSKLRLRTRILLRLLRMCPDVLEITIRIPNPDQEEFSPDELAPDFYCPEDLDRHLTVCELERLWSLD